MSLLPSRLRRLSLPRGNAYEQARPFVVNALISGLITVVPTYPAGLLLLMAMASVLGLGSPFARLLPEWLPAENLLALLLLLVVCFVVGVAVRTAAGRAARERLEKSLFSRLPGFALLRSLTQQLAGHGQEKVWKPGASIVTALASRVDDAVERNSIASSARRVTNPRPSCFAPGWM